MEPLFSNIEDTVKSRRVIFPKESFERTSDPVALDTLKDAQLFNDSLRRQTAHLTKDECHLVALSPLRRMLPPLIETSLPSSPTVCKSDPQKPKGMRSILPWFGRRETSKEREKPLPSILKSDGKFSCSLKEEEQRPEVDDLTTPVCKISSIDSDIPSLASTSTSSVRSMGEEKMDSSLSLQHALQIPRPKRVTRSASAPKELHFSPKVWVREFERNRSELTTTWYSKDEMEGFKSEALHLILKFSQEQETMLIPTGTGRVIQRRSLPNPLANSRALFSHEALQMDADVTPNPRTRKVPGSIPALQARKTPSFAQEVVRSSIKNILVVDPHDVFCKLFAKSFQMILPHIQVQTARDSTSALKLMQVTTFDVLVVEQRLNLFYRQQESDESTSSGSAFLKTLQARSKQCLLIGVTAHPAEDADTLKKAGADLVWSKPPPTMDQGLRDEILFALLKKRGPR